MQRVLDYIDQHLDENLGLDALRGSAAFSKHHFHRQFTAIFGVTLHRYIQLVRSKWACHQLAFGDDDSIINVSMDAGYESPETFARAFSPDPAIAGGLTRQAQDWPAAVKRGSVVGRVPLIRAGCDRFGDVARRAYPAN